MPNSEKLKTSYVPSEVRASVVSALLAVRRAQTLPTWRVEAAAAELGVSARTLWRWLEVAESEDRLTRKSRASFVIGEDVSAYYLMCRLEYGLTCRSRRGDHGMGSPPVTRVSRSLSR